MNSEPSTCPFPKAPPLSILCFPVNAVIILVTPKQHSSHSSLLSVLRTTSNCAQGPACSNAVTALRAKLWIGFLTGLSAQASPISRIFFPMIWLWFCFLPAPNSTIPFIFLIYSKCPLFWISPPNYLPSIYYGWPRLSKGDDLPLSKTTLSFSSWNLLFPLGFPLSQKIHVLAAQPIKTLPICQYPVSTSPTPGRFLGFFLLRAFLPLVVPSTCWLHCSLGPHRNSLIWFWGLC